MNVPGNVVRPLHTLKIVYRGQEFTTRERLDGMIIYVRQCAKWIRALRRFCEHNAMGVVVGDGFGGREMVVCTLGMVWDEMDSVCGVGAWEVVGMPQKLDELSRHPMLLTWHPVIGCHVHMRGAGAGPEKVKTRVKHKDPVAGAWAVAHNACREHVRNGRLTAAADVLLELAENKRERA
jgi:hypothetical protein